MKTLLTRISNLLNALETSENPSLGALSLSAFEIKALKDRFFNFLKAMECNYQKDTSVKTLPKNELNLLLYSIARFENLNTDDVADFKKLLTELQKNCKNIIYMFEFSSEDSIIESIKQGKKHKADEYTKEPPNKYLKTGKEEVSDEQEESHDEELNERHQAASEVRKEIKILNSRPQREISLRAEINASNNNKLYSELIQIKASLHNQLEQIKTELASSPVKAFNDVLALKGKLHNIPKAIPKYFEINFFIIKSIFVTNCALAMILDENGPERCFTYYSQISNRYKTLEDFTSYYSNDVQKFVSEYCLTVLEQNIDRAFGASIKNLIEKYNEGAVDLSNLEKYKGVTIIYALLLRELFQFVIKHKYDLDIDFTSNFERLKNAINWLQFERNLLAETGILTDNEIAFYNTLESEMRFYNLYLDSKFLRLVIQEGKDTKDVWDAYITSITNYLEITQINLTDSSVIMNNQLYMTYASIFSLVVDYCQDNPVQSQNADTQKILFIRSQMIAANLSHHLQEITKDPATFLTEGVQFRFKYFLAQLNYCEKSAAEATDPAFCLDARKLKMLNKELTDTITLLFQHLHNINNLTTFMLILDEIIFFDNEAIKFNILNQLFTYLINSEPEAEQDKGNYYEILIKIFVALLRAAKHPDEVIRYEKMILTAFGNDTNSSNYANIAFLVNASLRRTKVIILEEVKEAFSMLPRLHNLLCPEDLIDLQEKISPIITSVDNKARDLWPAEQYKLTLALVDYAISIYDKFRTPDAYCSLPGSLFDALQNILTQFLNTSLSLSSSIQSQNHNSFFNFDKKPIMILIDTMVTLLVDRLLFIAHDEQLRFKITDDPINHVTETMCIIDDITTSLLKIKHQAAAIINHTVRLEKDMTPLRELTTVHLELIKQCSFEKEFPKIEQMLDGLFAIPLYLESVFNKSDLEDLTNMICTKLHANMAYFNTPNDLNQYHAILVKNYDRMLFPLEGKIYTTMFDTYQQRLSVLRSSQLSQHRS